MPAFDPNETLAASLANDGNATSPCIKQGWHFYSWLALA